ncbi:hypothetical protein [Ideonella sp. YS5]|uniref:hypothetical protein n=1 Tax=Ideonella sp. YS5 TaxID=3453714 RepID=UPI003EEC4567
MNNLHSTALKLALAAAVCAFVGLVLSSLLIRSPALWPLVPDWLVSGTLFGFKPSTQEEAANYEFTALWALITMGFLSASLLYGWSRKYYHQASNPSIERTSPGKPGDASHVKR